MREPRAYASFRWASNRKPSPCQGSQGTFPGKGTLWLLWGKRGKRQLMEEKIQVQEPKERKDFGNFEKLRIQVSGGDRKKRGWGNTRWDWNDRASQGPKGLSSVHQPPSLSAVRGAWLGRKASPLSCLISPHPGHFLQLQMNCTVSFSPSTWPGYQGLERGPVFQVRSH